MTDLERAFRILAVKMAKAADVRRDAFDRAPTASLAQNFFTASLVLGSIGAALEEAANELEDA